MKHVAQSCSSNLRVESALAAFKCCSLYYTAVKLVIEAVAKSQVRLLPESALLNVSAPNDYKTVPGKTAVAVYAVTVLPLFATIPLWDSDILCWSL